MSKKAEVYKKELEVADPLVQRLAEIGGTDFEYMELLQHLENRSGWKFLPESCELRGIRDILPRLGIVELESGARLVVKDGSEILIPRTERKEMIRLLHLTHAAPETMMLQMKSRIFWPKQRQDLEMHYNQCKECTENRISRPQMKNEVDMSNLFDNFFPGGRIQMDFAERGTENFLVIVCQMSGFMQIYKCPQKSTEQALLRLREWCAQYGAPMACVSDNGPAFRNKFEEECKKMGIRTEHSSAYNPSSMSEVERAPL